MDRDMALVLIALGLTLAFSGLGFSGYQNRIAKNEWIKTEYPQLLEYSEEVLRQASATVSYDPMANAIVCFIVLPMAGILIGIFLYWILRKEAMK